MSNISRSNRIRRYRLASLAIVLTILGISWIAGTPVKNIIESSREKISGCFPFESYSITGNECFAACASDEDCTRVDNLYQAYLDRSGISSEGQGPGMQEKPTNARPESPVYNGAIALYDIGVHGELALKETGTSTISIDASLKDPALHRQMWNAFKKVFPEEYRYGDLLVQFELYTDGPGGEDASTGQTDFSTTWVLSLDPADSVHDGRFLPASDFYYALIHEYGHLLTLNPRQVPPGPESESASCKNYFPGEGCALPDSYINRFFDRFWKGGTFTSYKRAMRTCSDEADVCPVVDAWYEKRKSMFVTDYAATDPSEDIAETWAAFVLHEKPTGSTVADKKIMFFYQYPDLVKLRMILRGNLARAAKEMLH